MLIFIAALIASYIAAATRPIQAAELTAADRGLVSAIGWLGMFLTVADGLRNRYELDVFLRRVTLAAGALALVGLAQFVTKQQLTNYIVIPGLSENSDPELAGRGSFVRPAGTTAHPIEFGAVLTMILPIAIHYALTDTHRSVFRRWWPVAAIAIAVPISISRSAILSAVVVLVFLLPSLARPVRRRAYLALAVLGGAVYVVVPGLLGTLTGLFTGLSSDNSAKSRTGSFALVEQFFKRAPLFGRGFRTFTPSYRILDDQYLGLLVDTGLCGLLATVALSITAIVTMFKLRRRSTVLADRSLALSIAAGVAASALSEFLYDQFSFGMDSGYYFLILGGASVLYRVSGRPQPTGPTSPGRLRPAT
jgi:O-antigen ligase